jgi:4-amino-4-deoxy-L-arabinose transferase-like glycosyltransferase
MYPEPVTSERQPRSNRLILFALWLVFYGSFTLFTPPLLDDADSVHAEVAREMLTRHDFVTLYANGIRYLEKAPLFYWSMAASMRLFGANTAASRLPLAFSVLALALLLEALARRAFLGARAGLYAGIITLSSFGIFIFSRLNIPDILVCVLLTLSLYGFWLTENPSGASAQTASPFELGSKVARPTRLLCYTFAVAIALDLLTKGLIGIVFPIAIVGLYLLLTRGWRGALRRLLQYHPISSTALLLVIAAPWHILIALANPGHGHPGDIAYVSGHWQVPYPTDGNVHGWAWFYFINEQLYRYLNLRVPHDYDTSPLWLFYGLLFIWLMPWSAFLPSAIRRAWPDWRHPRILTPQARTNLFLLLWAAVPLLFFSLSTRQEYYVLPSLPPLILLIASLLAKLSEPYLPPTANVDEIARAANEYLHDHLHEAVAEYERRHTSLGRLAISSDAARELLPGYATPAERAANTFSLSPVSSLLADAVWAYARRVGPTSERYVATFLTGSPGSGKTSTVLDPADESQVAIISEGMMDHFEMSVARIQKAIDAGFVATIRLVFVNDPRITIRRAVSRAMVFGRPVSAAHMARLYVDIPRNVVRLSTHFGDNLGLIVFDNSIDGRAPILSSVRHAVQTSGAYTVEEALEAMLDELEELRNLGKVTGELYSQFRSPVGAARAVNPAAGSRDGSRDRLADHGAASRQDAPLRTGARAVTAVLLAFGALAALACLFFLITSRAPAPGTDLASLLTQNPGDYALSFGHFLDLTGPAMGLFRLPLALTAVALFGGTLAHFLLRRRNRHHAATLALAASAFLFLLAAHRGLVIFSPTLTSYQLAQRIAPQLHPQDLVAIHGEYEAGSTLGFYLRRNDIHIIEGRSSNLWYGSFFPDAPHIFNSRDQIAHMWLGPQRIFLWQDPHDPDRPPLQLPAPVYVIANSGGKQILSNQP